MFNVVPVRAFADNYIWVIRDNRYAAVVDPGEADPVIDYLTANNLQLTAILITHHHADHVGGVDGLLDFLELRSKVPVYGPAAENIPSKSLSLQEGDTIELAELALRFSVLGIPGHTAGHIAYVGQDVLFCGDTLFACGCGRLLEGTPQQMLASLNKLKALSGHTRVYCAHEYTLANIRFAEAVEPENAALKFRKKIDHAKREQNIPTIPSTIALELETNPFLRCNYATVQQSASRYAGKSITQPVNVFAAIREWKNNFR